MQAWEVETAVSLLASQSSPFRVFQVSEKPWAIKTGAWFLRSNTWGTKENYFRPFKWQVGAIPLFPTDIHRPVAFSGRYLKGKHEY